MNNEVVNSGTSPDALSDDLEQDSQFETAVRERGNTSATGPDFNFDEQRGAPSLGEGDLPYPAQESAAGDKAVQSLCANNDNDKKSEADANRKSEIIADKKSDTERKSAHIWRSFPKRPRAKSQRATVPILKPLKPWERMTREEERIRVTQARLEHLGKCFAFTLNFDHQLVGKALLGTKKFSTWANQRISDHLKSVEQILGRKILYWFCIEISEKGVYHLHGAIGVSDEMAEEVRRALGKAAGRRKAGASRYLVLLKEFDPTLHYDGRHGSYGWVAYAAKQLHITAQHNIGAPFVCRRELNQLARQLYRQFQAERKKQIAALKNGLARSSPSKADRQISA